MSRMKKHNLYHIKQNFEKKTSIQLISHASKQGTPYVSNTVPRRRFSQVAFIAVIISVFITLTAFAVSIFSTLGGDSLTMTASYHGGGVVWVEITNQSDKELKLEPKIRLYYYSTQEPVETTGTEPYISNLTIPANSTQKVRLDLRRTYNIETLENNKNDFYYLQMTNDSFLLGQKWSCMVSFVVSDYVPPYYEMTDESCLNGVLPSLKAYYQNFTPDTFERWPDAFDYIELVEAELKKVDGNVVRPSSPMLFCDAYGWLSGSYSSSFDGYNKLMGRDDTEDFSYMGVYVPLLNDDGEFAGGSWTLPLFYFYKYAVADIQSSQNYAFVRGNLLTFEEMEQYKVFEDDQYVVYEMHTLFYSDLRTYVEDMMHQRDDMYFDDQVWERIVNYYNYFSNKEVFADRFYYSPEGSRSRNPLTMSDVISISQKGEEISFNDFLYFGSSSCSSGYKHGLGRSFSIDDNYELLYSLNMNGTLKGWYLIHNPSGHQIDIRYDDVEAFVQEHGPAKDPYLCPKNEKLWHGNHVDFMWLEVLGNEISWLDFRLSCGDPIVADTPSAMRYIINENWYVDVYTEEVYENDCLKAIEDTILLIYGPSGEQCNLQNEDVTDFLRAHGE